jgi:hypothetical protein
VLAGLDQALRGFEADMAMLNEDFERERLPLALDALRNGLLVGSYSLELFEHDSLTLMVIITEVTSNRTISTISRIRIP